MTYGAWSPQDLTQFDRGRSFRKVFSQAVAGPVGLTVCIVLGSWFLYARLVAPDVNEASVAAQENGPAGAGPTVASNPYGDLLNLKFSLGIEPVPFARSAPLRAAFQPVATEPSAQVAETESVVAVPMPAVPQFLDNVPVPMPRPAELQAQAQANDSSVPLPPGRPAALQAKATTLATEPSDNRSFFEKLFGKQPSGPVLAYANPEDGAARTTPSAVPQTGGAYDRLTAVYDISARTVYMPNGKRLEAHSGLGDRLDDPRFVSERMRGATPPHIYDLTLRESLFHGVQALRLTPVGDGDVYGRAGLLVHRYMLSPNGDSNGCVSVKDYEAFLQAYRNGEIKRLAVVARLN
jgi:hypothetical protein